MKLDIVTRQAWNTMVTALTASLSAWQAARKGELDATRNTVAAQGQQAVSAGIAAQGIAQSGVNAAQSLYQQSVAALGIQAQYTSLTTALPALGPNGTRGAWRDAYGNAVIGEVISGAWVALQNQGSANINAAQQATASALAAPILARLRAGGALRLGTLSSSTFAGVNPDVTGDPAVYQNSERGPGMRFWRTLANRYGNTNVQLFNRGLGGARSRDLWLGNQPGVAADNMSGVGLMSAEAMVRTFKLDAILLQCNHNDAGSAVTPEQYYQHLYWAALGARRAGAMVFMVPSLAYYGYFNPDSQERQYHHASVRAAQDAGAVLLPVHEALTNATRTGMDLQWYSSDQLHPNDAGAQRYADAMCAYLVDGASSHSPRNGSMEIGRPNVLPGTPDAPGVYQFITNGVVRTLPTDGPLTLAGGRGDLGSWDNRLTGYRVPMSVLPRRVMGAWGLGIVGDGYNSEPTSAVTPNTLIDLSRVSAFSAPLGGAPGAGTPGVSGAALTFDGTQAHRQSIAAGSIRNLLFGRDNVSVTVAFKIPAAGANGQVLVSRATALGAGWMIYAVPATGVLAVACQAGAWESGRNVCDNALHVLTVTAQAGAGNAWVYLNGAKIGEAPIGSDRTEVDLLLGARFNDAGQTSTARFLFGQIGFAALGAAFVGAEEAATLHADIRAALVARGM